jgi:hypothetical protein
MQSANGETGRYFVFFLLFSSSRLYVSTVRPCSLSHPAAGGIRRPLNVVGYPSAKEIHQADRKKNDKRR